MSSVCEENIEEDEEAATPAAAGGVEEEADVSNNLAKIMKIKKYF